MDSIRKVKDGAKSTLVSTRSGSERAKNAREDSESILRSIVEKKPKQLFGSVNLADATAGASYCSLCVCSEVPSQFQQWQEAEFGEQCPRFVEAVIDGTVPPIAEDDV